MTFVKGILMLIVGVAAAIGAAYLVNWINHYEIPCFWPGIVAGAGSGAAALTGLLLREKDPNGWLVFLVGLVLFAVAVVAFKAYEYQSWRSTLIQSVSKDDSSFAQLPSDEKERILDSDLKQITGQTGYMTYLFFPRYSLGIDFESIPINIKLEDTWAVVFRFIMGFVDIALALGGIFLGFMLLIS
jgi:hypothetical protein